eukprot:3164367-Pyramimonas_sp.AAC.1
MKGGRVDASRGAAASLAESRGTLPETFAPPRGLAEGRRGGVVAGGINQGGLNADGDHTLPGRS